LREIVARTQEKQTREHKKKRGEGGSKGKENNGNKAERKKGKRNDGMTVLLQRERAIAACGRSLDFACVTNLFVRP